LVKLAPVPPVETPEAAYLGIDPRTVPFNEGPLIVAALGADPPERSVHFHLSLMSFEDGVVRSLQHEVPDDQLRVVLENCKRLDTRQLTVVGGEGVDHGLVWENGSVDLHTFRPDEAEGQPFRPHLPEGDGEPLLRRLIDDSINLLSGLPFNEERLDQGLQPINLLWPWGQGFRVPAPNLFLLRGEQAWVQSGSLRMKGLSHLLRYRHGDRRVFGKGVNVRLDELRKCCERESLTIIVLDAMAGLREKSRLEEMAWLSREIDDRLLQPLLDTSIDQPMRLAMLSPGTKGDGMALVFESRSPAANSLPFDERALEDKRLERRDVWHVVSEVVQAPATRRENIA
jgi:2,3-bisphosphoglycerate-independent phosphoglycerate mutase